MLTNESIEKRAREILSALTLKEKIGQLTQVHFSIEETDKLKQEIADLRTILTSWDGNTGIRVLQKDWGIR